MGDQIISPHGVVSDDAGHLYIAENDDNGSNNNMIVFSKNAPLECPSIYMDKAVQDLSPNKALEHKGVFHLFTHGEPGQLLIAGKWRNAPQIADWLLQEGHTANKSHLNIYGCNFAQGEVGRNAIAYLETILGISIAASDDVTGIDGDWELEVGTPIEALAFTSYVGNLQCVTSAMNCLAGDAFRDYDCDGIDDGAGEPALAGVEVFIYDCDNIQVGTATTDTQGAWQVCGLTDGEYYRVEFAIDTTSLAPTHQGSDNGTSIQFEQAGGACVNFGATNPADYFDGTEVLVTSCFFIGNNIDSTDPGIVSFDDLNPTTKNPEATVGVIGTVYGLAYSKPADILFGSAFQRRFTGFGTGGTGAIYSVPSPKDGLLNTATLFLDIDNLFMADAAGADPHDFVTTTAGGDIIDSASYDAVGTHSFW